MQAAETARRQLVALFAIHAAAIADLRLLFVADGAWVGRCVREDVDHVRSMLTARAVVKPIVKLIFGSGQQSMLDYGSMAMTKAESALWKKLSARGGKARAKNLSKAQRVAAAQKAANARWGKRAAA